MRIAVVGAGISGLGSAWLLGSRHEVVLYEAETRLGGHSHTVEVDDAGQPLAIDTGFIVYNERNYPLLSGLFAHLGVPTLASDMSFAASIDGGRVEYAGDDLARLFAQRGRLFDPSHWRMLVDILRFNREAKALLESRGLAGRSLGQFLHAGGYSAAFRDRYLLPMGGAIWSCSSAAMLEFPAESFVRFFRNHGLLDLSDRPAWRTVAGGARTYVERLVASGRFALRAGVPVAAVTRVADGVQVRSADGATDRFDQVVLATHADQSLSLLADATGPERELLAAVGYQPNLAVLHRDAALMPRTRAVWSSWNYLSGADQAGDRRVAVSYWMNRLQSLPSRSDWFVSLNPLQEPDPALTAGRYSYSHPVFTQRALTAQQHLRRVQGRERVWFAGAWTGYGFHEDGLRSAVEVAAEFGITPAWQQARGTAQPSAGDLALDGGRA